MFTKAVEDGWLFSRWTARRVRKRTTPRASTVDAVGISDESRRRSCLDKPRASRDRLVSAGTTGPQLPPHPTRSCASHDGEPRALGGPRGGRRPPGRRAPRDRRPRLLGRALAPRRCAHDRARRRRQDGASFPRYRARSGANARRLTLRLRKPSSASPRQRWGLTSGGATSIPRPPRAQSSARATPIPDPSGLPRSRRPLSPPSWACASPRRSPGAPPP